MSNFDEFWDRIKKANKPLAKAENEVKLTLTAAELRRLLKMAFEEGAKTAPPHMPSVFESIFGK